MNLSQISNLLKLKTHYENMSEDDKETIVTLFNTYKYMIFDSDKQIADVNKLLKTLK